jgi:L-ascorbate oxidase
MKTTKLLTTIWVLALLAGCGDDDDSTTVGDTASDTADETSETGETGDAPACVTLDSGECVTETFANPPVLQPDAQGVYQLELKPTEFTVNGTRHCGRGYGTYPAPTIDTPAARPGEKRQVRVNIRNRFTKKALRSLTAGNCQCTDPETGMSCTAEGHGHSLSACRCTDAEGNECHLFDFNVTNLHAHGSHVRPDYAAGGGCAESAGLSCRACNGDKTGNRECFFADDVISRVEPGQGAQHRWDIDEDEMHTAGLNWFHPHIHGSTAIQIAGGAAGTWIVRGAIDEIPGLKQAKERVLVITTPPTDLAGLAEGQACDEDHITMDNFPILGDTSKKQANLVNGVQRPRILMRPGQVERWRFLHASFLDEIQVVVFKGKSTDCSDLDLAAGPVPLTQIGRDGIPLPRPADGKDWPYAPRFMFMSPGYRIEALLDGRNFKDGETYCVMSARFLQEDTTGTTDSGVSKPPSKPEDIIQAASNGDILAVVNVTAKAGVPANGGSTVMPDLAAIAAQAPPLKFQNGQVDALARCAEVQPLTKPDDFDQLAALWLVFYNTDKLDACGFPDHNINAKNFERTDRSLYPYDRVLTKGAVDHWRVVSGFDGHPFHIHINPFVACPLPPEGSSDPNTKSRLFEPPFAHWRDTYLVNLDRKLDALTEYKSYTGTYVYHCHKLTHEDHGMMELLRVCDPATEDCDKLCDGRPCNWSTCAEGDDECRKALVATECALDPTRCPEAALRCTPCGPQGQCPPLATCSDTPGYDDTLRCVPNP